MLGDVKQIIGVLIVAALLVGALVYITNMENPEPELVVSEDGTPVSMEAPLAPELLEENAEMAATNDMNPIAVFTTNQGTFEIELFADQMPITTGNFIALAEDGFYDGTKFHRIIEGFMIQGGDPNSKTNDTSTYGTGDPGYKFADEINDNKLVAGSLAMANSGPNTNGSQFFIVTAEETSWLDGKHTNFGQVIDGMEVVREIEAVETGARDVPVEPIVINNIELLK